MVKKVGCMILSIGEEYKKLVSCASSSFKKFHPDVTLHVVEEDTYDSFECYEQNTEYIRNHAGIFRFAIASEIMEKHNYDKLIMLGGDTVTCARMDEFMDDDKHDILLTSCFAYQLDLPFKLNSGEFDTLRTPILCSVFDDKKEHIGWNYYFGDVRRMEEYVTDVKKNHNLIIQMYDHVYSNPDVTCFNSLDALKDVFKYSLKHWNDYHEPATIPSLSIYNKPPGTDFSEKHGLYFLADQGGLNMVANISLAQRSKAQLNMLAAYDDPKNELPNYDVLYIDIPYISASSVYNVRGKKSIEESDLPIGNKYKIYTTEENPLHGGPQNTQISKPSKFVLHPESHPKCGNEDGKSIDDYYVKDGKLFTLDDKQIKVWHYLAHFGLNTACQDFGRVNKNVPIDFKKPEQSILDEAKITFCDMINSYTNGIFNQETKDFFRDECDCGTFFHEEFTL